MSNRNSIDSDLESCRGSTLFSPTASLILVHDGDELENDPFKLSVDADDDDGGADIDRTSYNPIYELHHRKSTPPLSPTTVFLFLLSPNLKLGAILLPNDQMPLKYQIPLLVFFVILATLSRHILYKLARYLRKANLEDVVVDAFARGRGKEGQRVFLRGSTRFLTGILRVLVASMYLRTSLGDLAPFLPKGSQTIIPWEYILLLVIALFSAPLCAARSVAAKRIVFSAWLSIVAYLLWFGSIGFAHWQGTLKASPVWEGMGSLWVGASTTAFAFATSSTLPTYASLKGALQPALSLGPPPTPISRKFKVVSFLSAAVAFGLILPIVFFSLHCPLRSDLIVVAPYTAAFSALTLVLAIPSIIITTPVPSELRVSKLVVFITVFALGAVRQESVVDRIMDNLTLFLTLAGTYFMPALLHILTHQFKKPLSIVLPADECPSPSSPASPVSPLYNIPSPWQDELLLRKELTLQKRRFRKRVLLDIGVWVLLAPVGGGGLIWAIGRLADEW